MVYTESTKRKLDEILKAFGNYIREQDYFDIVYSEKIGYVIILSKHPGDAGAEQLDTPEKMLDVLFNEIILDVTNASEGKGCDADSSAPLAHEEAESRRRITAILETIIDGKEDYLRYLDDYLKEYQKSYSGD